MRGRAIRTAAAPFAADTVAAPMGTDVRFRRRAKQQRRARVAASIFLLGLLGAGCGGERGEPGERSGVATERTAPDGAIFNDADVAFVRATVAHHQQTVEIAELASVPGNEASDWLLPLAERIKASRSTDIERLQKLLGAWGEGAASPATTEERTAGARVADPTDVPGAEGMMSADEMIELTTTTGGDFDRLWLSMMLRHHEGAIEMAQRLLSEGRNGELQSIAATISTAHRAEAAEMESALAAVSPTTR